MLSLEKNFWKKKLRYLSFFTVGNKNIFMNLCVYNSKRIAVGELAEVPAKMCLNFGLSGGNCVHT